MLEYVDRFSVTETVMGRLLAAALSRNASYSDLFFEHTVENMITMEEGIVKESVKSVSLGLGIRAVKGESTGYAFTEDLSYEKMHTSALTAAAIADSPAEVPPIGIEGVAFENHYPIGDPSTGTPLEQKVSWIHITGLSPAAFLGFGRRNVPPASMTRASSRPPSPSPTA